MRLWERWQTSFRFRLVLATIAAICLTVALLACVQYVRQIRVAEAAQNAHAEKLANLMAESLAQPMFDFNTAAVELAAKALATHTGMRRMRVSDETGKAVVDTGAEVQASEILLTLRRPILYQDGARVRDVGSIEMAFSRGDLDDEIYAAALETLLGALLVVVATVFTVLWAFRSVTRPLTAIAQGLNQLAAGETEIDLPSVHRDDEFGHMCAALEHFREAIRERVRAESVVRESEERFRDFSQSSADWFWEMDEALRFSYFSDNFATILGVDPVSLLGQTRFGLAGFAILNQSALRAELLGKLARRESFRNVEYHARRPDGSMLWVSVSGIARFDPDGTFLGYRGVGQNVTARRLAEEEARKLSLVVEQSPSNVIITNARAEIEYVNEAFTRLTGYCLDEVRGRNPRFLQSGQTARENYESLWRALGNGESWQGEFINRRKDGGIFVERGYYAPLRLEDGSISHYVAIKEDVTERKRVESELAEHRQHLEVMVVERTTQLAEAKEAAEAASRAKGAFVANMSHEIRTPLNAVLGLARIIMRENEGRKSGRTAAQILEAGEHLLGVINDILDFSRIEAGKLLIEMRPFRLAACVEESLKLVADRATAKGLQLQVELGEELPQWVEGDRLRLEQILINLLSNAVKFTERGRIVLSVRRLEDCTLRFKVADSGIGMSADQVQRLFQPFEQADASTTRKYGGSGLGLVISRNLACQMGGEISVESTPGRGSVFSLNLPLREVPADEMQVPMARSGLRLSGLHVLAVEDMELNRIVLEDMLVNEGAHVTFAEHGLQALALLEARGRAAFDLVLTDIQMPVMDGYELAQRISQVLPGLPVIGLTAHAMPEERQRCLNSGMLAHVSKPVDNDELVSTILRHASASVAQDRSADCALDVDTPSGVGMIDWVALSGRYRGRTEFSEKLLGILVRTHADTPLKLRNAARASDIETLRSLAHTLQGVAGNIEAGSLRELAIRVEQSIHEGGEDGIELAIDLAASMDALLDMLRERAGQDFRAG